MRSQSRAFFLWFSCATWALLGVPLVQAAPGGFTFATPPGWLNISPDAPESERQNVHPESLRVAQSGQYAFYAVENGNGGANINAIVQTGKQPPRITLAVLDGLEKGALAGAQGLGMTFRIIRKDLVKIGGVTAGRLLSELRGTQGEGDFRVLQYVIPGEMAVATLTFTAPADAFATYERTFEDTAQAMRGAREPSGGVPWGVIAGAAAAGAMGASAAARAKKKQATPPPAAE